MLKRYKVLYFMLLLGGVIYSTHVEAQNSTIGWKDYLFIKNSEGWFGSENASGLKELSVDNISQAEILFQKQNGKFVNYYQSDDSYQIGANVESFYRLNPRVILFGKISYDTFKGGNMAGSAFIQPYHAPFDFVEYTDDTQGNKKLETYNLTGAVSADIYKGIILGAKVDFTAANYAKDKDLRHKNKLSDMVFTTGLSYKINSTFDIGLSYYYRRRSESLEFSIYGLTGNQQTSLISYGGFFGKTEQFGESGYTSSSEKPLFEKYHGAALQVNVDFNSKLTFFNELTYKKRDGYFGKRATSSIVYSEHNSTLLGYQGKLNYRTSRDLHSLDIHINNEELENLENVYKEEKPQGSSSSIITYYDPLKVGDRKLFNATINYTANLDIQDYNPKWVLGGGLNFFQREQTASVYPYYRKQNLKQTSFNLHTKRNIIKGINMYSIMLYTSYTTGNGDVKNDELYNQAGEDHVTPPSSDKYLYHEYEFLTNDQIKGSIEFKYSRLFENIGIKGYALASYSYTKGLKVKHISNSSLNTINIAIGCTF